MTETPTLWEMLGIFFNQDMSSDYGTEEAAIDAFIQGDPEASLVVHEIELVLRDYPNEGELATYLESQGSQYVPPPERGGYQGWMLRVAKRVQDATG